MLSNRVLIASSLYLFYFIQFIFLTPQKIINFNIFLIGGGGLLEILHLKYNQQKNSNDYEYNNKILNYLLYTWFLSLISWYYIQPIIVIRSILALQISDALQYIVGSNYPIFYPFSSLSPNKSIGGYFGGIFLSMIVPLVYNLFFSCNVRYDAYFFLYIFGCLGDLYASYVKRIYKIKDYSYILSSHGGILDRFDSIIIAGPIAIASNIFKYL